ncbi:uncharacterized protein RCH25_053077 [Pelodytes ibericus]
MDGIKQENYALLHDDSDVEDYDKSKVGSIKVQQGKTYSKRSKTICAWAQRQWLCHTVFIVFLVSSQAALCIFILTMHIDLKTIKQNQASLQKGYLSYNNNMSSSRFENATHVSVVQKVEDLPPDFGGTEKLNLLKRLHTVEMNMKSMKRIVSISEEDSKSLQIQQKVQGKKYENALERQFNNITKALNSLQNRLEENLEIAFSQMAHLRDDVFFIENALNHTKQEHLGGIESTQKPKTTIQVATNQLPIASQTWLAPDVDMESNVPTCTFLQILSKTGTTMQPTSKQNDMSEVMFHISIPFLKSRGDFQVFFYGADKDANGYLTYDEIKKVLGIEAPSEDVLLQFDDDQNNIYSYTELIRIFQLKEL